MQVYLDSNAYISANYRVDSGNMKFLVNLIESGKVKLLYTDINVGEVNQHIEQDVKDGITKYNRLYRKELAMLDDTNYELNIDDTINEVKSRIENVFNLRSTKNIPLNPLDANKLLKDYFSKNPPFENKKPNEFKDAIMINAIKNYQKQLKEPIYIVSDDDGFLKAFENNESFKTFEFLGYFLKYYNEQEKELDDLIKFIENNVYSGKYDDKFKEYIDNNYFISMNYYEKWDCSNQEISDISYELLYLEKEGEKIYATISTDIDLKLDITYRNEDMSYYDKEEHRYLFEEYVNTLEKHRANVDLKVCFHIDPENNGQTLDSFEIINDTKKLLVLDLDEDTLVNYEVIPKENNDELVFNS